MNQTSALRMAAVLPFSSQRSQKTHADSHPLPPRPAAPDGGPRPPEPPRVVVALARAA